MRGGVLVYAGPVYASKSVSSPHVTAGKLEVASKTEVDMDDDDDVHGSWEQTFEVTYGLTDRVAVQVSTEFQDEPGEDVEAKELELEGKLELTEKGAFFIDSGIKIEYEKKLNTGADEISATAIFSKKIGDSAHTANFKIEREIGDDSADHEKYEIKWRSKYEYSSSLDFGFEYHGDLRDTTDDYSGQKHNIGPVLYGTAGAFKYDAGVLGGVSKAASDAILKVNVSYKF